MLLLRKRIPIFLMHLACFACCCSYFAQFALADQKNAPTSASVVLIIVDTLGSRHLGYSQRNGGKKSPSPNIDKFARSSAVFENAYSTAPWTKPAVASIFSSTYPSQHKVGQLNSKLKQSVLTMAEILKGEGYKTAGIVSHNLIKPGTGYEQGFDYYDIVKFKGNVHDSITSHQVTDMGLEWLMKNGFDVTEKQAEASSLSKYFLFLHYFDPHFNYQHHQAYDRSSWYKGRITPGLGFRTLRNLLPSFTPDDTRYLQSLYHEEIEYTDLQIARLLDALNRQKHKPLIILTADHGEEFLEHGSIGHTWSLYNELIHVPLIFSWESRIAAKSIPQAASSMDILPTVMELFKFKAGDEINFSGDSLVSLLQSKSSSQPSDDRDIYAEVDYKSSNITAHKLAIINDSLKLILDKDSLNEELYALKSDPLEKDNLINKDTQRSQLEKLRNKLKRYQSSEEKALPPSTKANDGEEDLNQTPEEVEQLKSLGYM